MWKEITMSEAEKLFSKAIEMIETLPYGEAQDRFLEDEECNELASDCACALSSVWDMAVWAVCELIPLDDLQK